MTCAAHRALSAGLSPCRARRRRNTKTLYEIFQDLMSWPCNNTRKQNLHKVRSSPCEPNTECATPQACESLEKFSMVAERCARDSLSLSEAVLRGQDPSPVGENASNRHGKDTSCWFLELLTLKLCEGSGLSLSLVGKAKRAG